MWTKSKKGIKNVGRQKSDNKEDNITVISVVQESSLRSLCCCDDGNYLTFFQHRQVQGAGALNNVSGSYASQRPRLARGRLQKNKHDW